MDAGCIRKKLGVLAAGVCLFVLSGIFVPKIVEANVAITFRSPVGGTVGTTISLRGTSSSEVTSSRPMYIDFGTNLTITFAETSAWSRFTNVWPNTTEYTEFVVNTQSYGTKVITARQDQNGDGDFDDSGEFATTTFVILPNLYSCEPPSGPVGSPVTIMGNGFGTTTIRVDFGTSQTITTALGNQNGTFSLTFMVDTQTYGTKVITVYNANNLSIIDTTTFFITSKIVSTLRVLPQSMVVIKNSEFIEEISIEDAYNLKVAEIHLSFNTGVLEVLELDDGEFSYLSGTNSIRTYDNTLGQINYAVAYISGSKTGSGVLAKIKFRAKNGGTSSISFDFDYPNNRETKLIDDSGNSQSFAYQGSLIFVADALSIYPKNKIIPAGGTQTYQAFGVCGLTEVDVSGSTTFTSSGGGSFTTNIFEAYYIGTYIIKGEFFNLVGTTNVFITSGTQTTILYISGDNQTANCEETLSAPFVVRVIDSYGNPVPNIPVEFTIAEYPVGASGFSLSATQTSTNINGLASSTLTLGTEPPGTYTIYAINSDLSGSPIIFKAYSLRRFGNISGICLVDFGTEAQKVASITVKIIETEATVTTNVDSSFIFTNILVGTYTLTFDYPGATPATKTNVCITKTQFNHTTDIGTITLISGDTNGDGKINTDDWPDIVDSFGSMKIASYNKNCDFNADGRIDGKDLFVFAKNFGKYQIQTKGKRGKRVSAKGQGGIVLRFSSESIDNAKPGDVIPLGIIISNAKDSLCGEIHLAYDKELLSPMGNVGRGTWLSKNFFEFINRVEDGKIDYAFGLMEPEETDGGILGTIKFVVKKQGSSEVSFNFDEKENRETMFTERKGGIDTSPSVDSEPIRIDAPVIFNNLEQAYCFPNPARKNDNKVTFKNISGDKDVTLRLYNTAGELVYEQQHRTNVAGEFDYNLKNKDGKDLAPGIYIWILDDGKDKKKGKIGVIR